MLLVIGKPGSGCTTFLKTLAGLRAEFHDTRGSLTYGGKSIDASAADSVRVTFCGRALSFHSTTDLIAYVAWTQPRTMTISLLSLLKRLSGG
jgi:ABC-type multidrug transport system ATPase subunit